MRNTSEQTVGRINRALDWSSRIMGLARVLGAILLFALLHDSVHAFTVIIPPGQSVNLAWDQTTDPNIAGYRMHYGVASHAYTNTVDAGKATNVTISGLVEATTYYFAVTAYNAFGLESNYSKEAGYTVPGAVPGALAELQIRVTPNGQVVLHVSGQIGHTYDILATQTFTAWTVIGTVTLGANGSVDFTDTNATSYAARNYRTREKP